MYVIKSLRQLISKGRDDSNDDSFSTNGSSTRTGFETRTQAEKEDEHKAEEDDEDDIDNDEEKEDSEDDSDSDDEDENHQEAEAVPENKNEEEASDAENFSDEDVEDECDVYGDLVSSDSMLDSFRSVGYGVIPTDLISTRTARDSSPRLAGTVEYVKSDEEQHTTEDRDFNDVRTAETIPSQTNLVAQESDNAEQDHNEVTPPFESPDWKGQPNASRRPPCKCIGKGRQTCTCSFLS